MKLTQVERELFNRESSDYSALLETIRTPVRPAETTGLQLTCIGNSGGATSVVRGNPAGGFLLRCEGRTLIVDPGDNSVAGLAKRGFDPFEITDVLASHCHNDHVGDLSLAVSAAINLGLAADTDSRIVVAPPLADYGNPDATRYGFTLPAYAWKSRVEVLYFEDARTVGLNGETIQALRQTQLPGGINVSATEARHGGVQTMGFVIETRQGRIGYTSDTEYFDGLADWFQGVDILWMNMNTLALDAMIPDRSPHDTQPHLTHNHLGYAGVCRLLEEVRPKSAIVSHLGAQLIGMRAAIQTALRRRFADTGMAVFCPETGDSLAFDGPLGAAPELCGASG